MYNYAPTLVRSLILAVYSINTPSLNAWEEVQNDMHNLSGEVSCTYLQMFVLNFDGDVGSPLCRPPSPAFFLPPFHTSFPQAFCSSATREDKMTERTVQHSISVSEFLLRHGNAPTRLHAHSNTLRTRVRPLVTTHTAHVDGGGKKYGETWSRLIFLFINRSLQCAFAELCEHFLF